MTVTMWLGTDATSPTDFSTAANWSTGSVPVASDDLIFTNSYVLRRSGLHGTDW